MTTTQIGHAVICELDRAYAKHGRTKWGRHEFYAILKEEVDELWDAIKSDAEHAHVEREAIQIATMVFRHLETGERQSFKSALAALRFAKKGKRK